MPNTNLDFLLDSSKYHWTPARSEKLLELKRVKPDLSLEEIAEKLQAPLHAVRYHLAELRRAARAGMSFEEYWRLGRPLRLGKEKLIPGRF